MELPFGAALTGHFADLDAHMFRFDIGVLKPDLSIFEWAAGYER
jgi:hypothetical protein